MKKLSGREAELEAEIGWLRGAIGGHGLCSCPDSQRQYIDKLGRHVPSCDFDEHLLAAVATHGDSTAQPLIWRRSFEDKVRADERKRLLDRWLAMDHSTGRIEDLFHA